MTYIALRDSFRTMSIGRILAGLGDTGRCKAFTEEDRPCKRKAQPRKLICRKCEEWATS